MEPRLIQRSGIYYIQYSRTKKKSLKTSDRRLASAILEVETRRVSGQATATNTHSIPLSLFADDYISFRSHERAANTLRLDAEALRLLGSHVGHQTPISSITIESADKFKAFLLARGLSPKTVNIRLRHLKAAFNKALYWGKLQSNPFTRIEMCKIKDDMPRAMSRDEVARVISVIEHDITERLTELQKKNYRGGTRLGKKIHIGYVAEFLEFFIACLLIGGRRTETAGIRWEHFRLVGGEWELKLFRTKTRNRVIPVPDKMIDLLWYRKQESGAVFPHFHDYPNEASKYFRKYATIAGLDDAVLHDLRHTSATWMLMSGVPMRHVSQILGHAKMATTELYTKLLPSQLRQGINAISVP